METRDHSTPNLSTDSAADSTAEDNAVEGENELTGAVESQNEKGSGPPDGGLKAWSVVAGGLINYCATFGMSIAKPNPLTHLAVELTLWSRLPRLAEFVRNIPDTLPK